MAKRHKQGGFPGGGANMNQIMKQAQRLQKQMEEAQNEAQNFFGEAEVGGGMVKVKINADHQIENLEIKEEVVDPDDVEMLQDLIIAAVNEAIRQLDEKTETHMSKLTSGIGGLGGLGGFGF